MPARSLCNFLIQSALARTQRDDKVLLSNYLWMANHPHIVLVSRDVNALKRFYEELKKRITDYTKRLLGLSHLNLFPDASSVPEVLDLEKAIARHIYIFLNPVRAGLVDSIDEYPGESSWRAFLEAQPSVDACRAVLVPWIRLPSIPRLSRANPSWQEEESILQGLMAKSKEKHELKIYPFAWLKVFGITDPREIEAIRQRIIGEVRATEAALREQRKREGIPVKGNHALKRQALLVPHVPKSRERSIFFLSSEKELRLNFLREFKAFCERCEECFHVACQGVREVLWPEGAFVPPLRPLCNPIV